MYSGDMLNYLSAATASINLTANIISLAITVLTIIGKWKTFDKAGEPGWAAIIPFYNAYITYKLAGRKTLFWVYLICIVLMYIFLGIFLVGVIGAVVSGSNSGMEDMLAAFLVSAGIGAIILFALWIAAMTIQIIMYVGLSKSFGQSGALVFGFLFLPVVCWLLFGFDNRIRYHSPLAP